MVDQIGGTLYIFTNAGICCG